MEVRKFNILIEARGGLYGDFRFERRLDTDSDVICVSFKRYRHNGDYNATFVAFYKGFKLYSPVVVQRHNQQKADMIKDLITVSKKVKEFVEGHLW